jgi:hypothetical protein
LVDYSRIEPLFLLKNYLLGLQYNEGFVFMRVKARELLPLFYDPKYEISTTSNLLSIAAGGSVFPANPTFIAKQFFGSGSSQGLNSSNILKASKNFDVYQAFMGIQPSAARVFLAVEGTEQKELDEGSWGTNSDYRFGYISGYDSAFESPGPRGEFFVPPNVGYTFGVANPMPYTISPTFIFIINRLNVAIVKDVNLIQKILQGVVTCRLVTIGGLVPPKYNMAAIWNVNPVQINASAQDIAKAVTPS